jgi:hypothetical protein
MRTRTILGSSCPNIFTYEWKWLPDEFSASLSRLPETMHPFYGSGSNWTLPSAYKDHKGTLVDDTGDDSRFRGCTHTWETNEFSAPFVEHRMYRGWGGNAYVKSMSSTTIDTALNLRTPPPISMDDYGLQALAFMLPELNRGTSLVNSILELKDFKRMNPSGTLRRLRKRHNGLRDLANPILRKDFIREAISRMNNAALNASFGIVPFIQDIVQIHDDLTTLAMRLERLKKYAGTKQQRHYKRVIPESSGVPAHRNWVRQGGSTALSAWVPNLHLDKVGGTRTAVQREIRSRWVVRPVYHATMRYIYTLPKLDSALEGVYARLDSLGVRLDPSIIWNAIPFSFIVDWVVDVSGFLSSFARNNYPIEVEILDFCHSYKWYKEIQIELFYDTDVSLVSNPARINAKSPYGRIGPIPVYKGTRSSYSRVLGKPSIHAARTKAPKLRHAALAASLLLSRTGLGKYNDYLKIAKDIIPKRWKR